MFPLAAGRMSCPGCRPPSSAAPSSVATSSAGAATVVVVTAAGAPRELPRPPEGSASVVSGDAGTVVLLELPPDLVVE